MTAQLLQEGRLSQHCPACNITEAAGFYCTRCFRPMDEPDWFTQERSEAQLAGARAGRRAQAARRPGGKETAHTGG